ncbi:MAG: methylmalonyl-CoA carboxyltransferase, partial [Clostridiaceae bacterium]|nr:methylmalonyl-CoA carboxyltransferase [Clostridiaceae bacterium]
MLTEKQKKLTQLKEVLAKGGGDKAVERQHDRGKMTARERVIALFDDKSFVETGLFVKHRATQFGMDTKQAAGDGVVTGYGTIDGRLVCVAAQDFTVIGGSLGEMHADKIVRTQEMAMKVGAP